MKEKIFLAVLAFLGVIGLLILSTLWGGYVSWKLWNWLLVPILGAPALTFVQAISVKLIVGYFTLQKTAVDKEDKGLNAFAFMLLVPAFALFVGWILKDYI